MELIYKKGSPQKAEFGRILKFEISLAEIFDASTFATIESAKLYSTINSSFRLKNIKNSVEEFGIPGKIVQRRPVLDDSKANDWHQSGCLILFLIKNFKIF